MKKIIAALCGILALVLTGCASASTPADLKGVHYSGGRTQAKKFKDCLEPSSRSGWDPGDKFFLYPTRQISYDATGSVDSESDRFKVVSKDNAELYVPVTVTFNLKTDCETLRKFHETVGSRYSAFIESGSDINDDDNTTSADVPNGWVKMLNYVIGKPLDVTLDRVAQDYDYRSVWNDPKVKVQMEAAVNANLQALVTRQAGGDFFENFNVLILKPDPVDENLKAAISDEQAAVAQANAEKAKAEADTATATAQERLALAQARTKKAEIEAYGGVEAYLRYQCIQTATCGNPYRDQLLYGGAPTK